jgi:alkanesulfonate monooxygenase SsuD/methylene tetrahydromethanopterin reductase-like flavin-dependent oxidoreductase (luciferase family)
VTNEAIEAIKALWTMEKPSHHGRFFSFDGIDSQPRPVQKPHPPIVVGGKSRHGARRAARYGNGWFGFLTDIEATSQCLEWIDDYIANGERPGDLGDIEISVTPPMRLTGEVIDRYEEIGVHRLIPVSTATTLDESLRFVDKLGDFASR